MAIRVITFDLDNTLWDVEPALLRAEQAQRQWLLTHRPGAIDGLDREQLEQLRKQVLKSHPELAHHVSALRKRLLQILQERAGFDRRAALAGAQRAFAVFLRERQRVALYAGALEVLQHLAGRYQLGALTNGNADIYQTEAGEYFDFALLAENIGASKPAPAMFHAALEQTGARPSEVIHVGDHPEHDVLGARRVGLRAVWINPAGQRWQYDERPDAQVEHLGQLAPAIAAIDV